MTITNCAQCTTPWARIICSRYCALALTPEELQQFVTLGKITQAQADEISAFCPRT